jgi:hypothetical protein
MRVAEVRGGVGAEVKVEARRRVQPRHLRISSPLLLPRRKANVSVRVRCAFACMCMHACPSTHPLVLTQLAVEARIFGLLRRQHSIQQLKVHGVHRIAIANDRRCTQQE